MNIIHKLITHYKIVLFTSLLFIFIASLGMKNLYFDANYKVFFNKDNPQLIASEEMEDEFDKTDNISLVISPKDGVFNERYLTIISDLTERLWQTPYSSRVNSIANYQHTESENDELIVENLYYSEELNQEKIKKIKHISLSEPQLADALISKNGKVTLINITLQTPRIDHSNEVEEVNKFLEKIISEYKTEYPDELEFHKTGLIALNLAFKNTATKDTAFFVPLMLATVLILLYFQLRSFNAVATTLFIITTSVTTTLGIAGWLGMAITSTTSNIPLLIMTIAVADSVHILSMYQKQKGYGFPRKEAIINTVSSNNIPILITSLTTAIGFLMLNASDSPAFNQMGNLAALGIVIAYILSITLLPALLRIIPVTGHQESKASFSSLIYLIKKYNNTIIAVSALIIIGSIIGVQKNNINDQPTEYFSKKTEFRQATDFLSANIGGMTTISISIKTTNEQESITDISYLNLISEFTDWIKTQEYIDHVASLSDVMKRLNKSMHNDDPSYFKIPQDPLLAAQYLLLYEISLPDGLDLSNQINLQRDSSRIAITLENIGSKELVAVENKIRAYFKEKSPKSEINVSSPALMFAHIGENNMKSILMSLPISLLLISAIMIFTLRSFKLGIISIVPNIIPALIGFGAWGYISGEINLGLAIVTTLTLGIVVDDTVHFLQKYKLAKQRGLNAEQSIQYTFDNVGRALLITTFVLTSGFAILSMSDFRLNSDMGLLSSMIIMIAIIIDFILLPTLLLKFDQKEKKNA